MITPTFQPEIEAYEPSLAGASRLVAEFATNCIASQEQHTPANPFTAAMHGLTHGHALKWLTLSGVNGCGKTLLARQLKNFVARNYPYASGPRIAGHGFLSSRRPEVVWIDEVNFVQRCKSGEYDLPEYLGEDWLVVVDDLGASRDKSGYAGEMLFKLCNARIDKFTLFTTNLSLDQVGAQIDPRIMSRLIRDGNKFCQIKAGDYAVRQLRARAIA
jgi:DNA replication protein DnaC